MDLFGVLYREKVKVRLGWGDFNTSYILLGGPKSQNVFIQQITDYLLTFTVIKKIFKIT